MSLGLLGAGYAVLPAIPAAIAAILGALALGGAILWRRPAPAYAAAVIWALTGIVAATAAIGVALLAATGAVLLAALTWWRGRATSP